MAALQIGKGHFARVYLAEEVRTGGQYAIKVVSPTEPSLDAELEILRTIAAQVRSKHDPPKHDPQPTAPPLSLSFATGRP
jgi:serine/threonine protein kinase